MGQIRNRFPGTLQTSRSYNGLAERPKATWIRTLRDLNHSFEWFRNRGHSNCCYQDRGVLLSLICAAGDSMTHEGVEKDRENAPSQRFHGNLARITDTREQVWETWHSAARHIRDLG